jgi:hypothetical protein
MGVSPGERFGRRTRPAGVYVISRSEGIGRVPQGSLDLLLSLVALTSCMRLSSMKAAHAVLSGAA